MKIGNIKKIRKKMGLPKLSWKEELTQANYEQIDKKIAKLFSDIYYGWYFRNVFFFDQKYKTPLFVDRIILTRKSIIFLTVKRISFPISASVNNQYWSFNKTKIVSPITKQQFMMNRLLDILNVKLLLNTAAKNVVFIQSAIEPEIRDSETIPFLTVMNIDKDNIDEALETLLSADDNNENVLSDETIVKIHEELSIHSHANPKTALKQFAKSFYIIL